MHRGRGCQRKLTMNPKQSIGIVRSNVQSGRFWNDSRLLTETFNRGELILLTDQSKNVLVPLKGNLGSFTSGRQENLGRAQFEQFCSKDQDLTGKFEDGVYASSKPEDLMCQERLFSWYCNTSIVSECTTLAHTSCKTTGLLQYQTPRRHWGNLWKRQMTPS